MKQMENYTNKQKCKQYEESFENDHLVTVM